MTCLGSASAAACESGFEPFLSCKNEASRKALNVCYNVSVAKGPRSRTFVVCRRSTKCKSSAQSSLFDIVNLPTRFSQPDRSRIGTLGPYRTFIMRCSGDCCAGRRVHSPHLLQGLLWLTAILWQRQPGFGAKFISSCYFCALRKSLSCGSNLTPKCLLVQFG